MTENLPTTDDLTLEEKAALTSGADFWRTKPIERLGVPAIMMTDGPHGLRKQSGASDHLGLAESVPATCFPPAVALGSSFDPELAQRVGVALGTESAIEDVAVILGPGVNIKRSPLCGRNFEYFSEDPIVSGAMAAGLVRGIQSRGVGASLKHFAANNQETDRLRVSSDVDPRPLREIYLRGFQRVVEDAQPWTVMCAYNRINGVYASEDPWLLTSVLRGEWGFEGLVVSDWGAVNNRVVGLPAGLDLEMPSSGGRTDAELVAAVQDGSLDEVALDIAAGRVLDLIRKTANSRSADVLDVDAHHALAHEAASRSIVLLKNDGGMLPLAPSAKIAVVGAFAETPRYQGAGSSLINPTRLDAALDAIRELADGDVAFAPGFTLDGSGDAATLREEAVVAAAGSDATVLFLGLPAEEESEGFDREHIDLPAAQLALLDALLEAGANVAVVLSNGGVVALPFADRVPAILEGWLLGQAGGSATADVLFGVVNPSAKLTETIPLRLEDTPSFGYFPGEFGHVRYGEGIFVGYRGFDAKKTEVAFPFGHGLSYTSFAYSDAAASVSETGDVVVTATLTNTGEVAGREIVQVYTSLAESLVARAPRELKAFGTVQLDPGESRRVELVVRRGDLAYWDTRVDEWVVEGGEYTVEVAASSRDIRASTTVTLEGDAVRVPLSQNSSIGDLLENPVAGPVMREALKPMFGDDQGMLRMMASFPIGRLAAFPNAPVSTAQIEELLASANAAP
ncbi:glycoside hydrolase family 3 C-terminal domain-containing protein [Microbacterium sp. cx-59]|uniref:glycoside hydrolase family 3 C-terminal domain-containing protein n=1 Tax=Microbacterium sp. cx-59 TaxID=2891207 RepID=UPI001E40F9DD|nr:glycoside hydrolase family 3 C-terminal domain-containing protein [Microbacterium sp. cx-59]MCC4909273.1 glycoside hydrolase family 3 C-terminal domain-containing protein [Microbacterium sp. cx-59]